MVMTQHDIMKSFFAIPQAGGIYNLFPLDGHEVGPFFISFNIYRVPFFIRINAFVASQIAKKFNVLYQLR
jgi:hypothetical protein